MNIFILGHLLADFVFQRDCDVEEKRNGIIKGNLKHMQKVTALYIVSALYFVIIAEITNIVSISLVALFISVNLIGHFMLDLAKSKLQAKLTNMNLPLLFLDQLLHIMILIVSFNLILKDFINIDYQGNHYIILLIFLLISTFVSSVIIREILDLFHLDTKVDMPIQNAEKAVVEFEQNRIKIGKWIGIIERTIMFLSIYFNILGLLTIVVAFKTLSRYENIKKNPEYYIIGNLLSILLVLVTYGIFKTFI